MVEKGEKKPVFMIRDLETLKVVTDPLHLQILEILSPAPQTVSQVADKLGSSSSRLYYHFNLLESAGLIRVVETRTVNNIIEKIFWVTADDIDIDKDLLNFSSSSGQENVTRVAASMLDATREDIMRSLQVRKFELDHGAKPNPRDMVIKVMKKRLRDETYHQFVGEFNQLMAAFNDLPDEDGHEDEVGVFSVACFIYPSFYFAAEDDDATGDEDHA